MFIEESPTAKAITEMTLYGKRPFSDELDHRPLPDSDDLANGLSDSFDVLTGLFADTRLEDDLQGILWGFVNVFQRKVTQVQKALDQNEDQQRKSQRQQDGSEVKSVELEDLITEGRTMLEQRQVFELMRDVGSELFEAKTGSVWQPRAGSTVNHQSMTASMITSRDYLKAKRKAETQLNVPDGTLIAFAGGMEFEDVNAIYSALDKVKANNPDMVLMHGGAKKGAELIAAKWAANRRVTAIIFAPDWERHNRAAPFKRNDLMLAQAPKGVVIFPGSGITENLADKARALSIKVFRPVK
ncbi:DUF2493 domain-containing protein [Kordiimonas pumila]|uniref:DUF2493 domain-containing protein n=1 Tax=Kordiimonas pumila TaxID=2161677 RepID=A0ABV7D605_9PROT|nr:DUF2493 domain-containing protein [Kordiimonas pumila]